MRRTLGFCLLLLSGPGCVSAPRPTAVGKSGPECAVSRAPAPPPRAIVFTADGIGGYGATTTALREIAEESSLPLFVQTVPWSHGHGRILADHVDYRRNREEGRKLAAQIACYLRPQQQGPPLPVSLVAHSGGSAVVLAATEFLPPNSIERIVLLAPSVSADYDLRPALRCARQGVDVFHSQRDRGYLGVGVATFGTADRRWTSAAAGRVGFRLPPATCPEDTVLYARLRQHPWEASVAWTGNDGGHFGSHNTAFLRAYVVPLLLPSGRTNEADLRLGGDAAVRRLDG